MLRSKNSKYLFFLFLLVALPFVSLAQRSIRDLDLIAHQDFTKSQFEKQHRNFLLTRNSNPLLRYNPVTLAFGAALYVYQNTLSRQLSASCLYSPSCSEFSKILINRYGLIKGIFLTSDRILRCNRIAVLDIKYFQFDDHDHKVHESPLIYKYSP